MKYRLKFADAIEYAFDELIVNKYPLGLTRSLHRILMTDRFVKDVITFVNELHFDFDTIHPKLEKRSITKIKFDLKYYNFMSLLNLSANDVYLSDIFKVTDEDKMRFDGVNIRPIPITLSPDMLNTYTGNAIIEYTNRDCLIEYDNIEKLLGLK